MLSKFRSSVNQRLGVLSAAIALSIVSPLKIANARPAPVFTPHLQEIRSNLPPGWTMRLPARILLSYPADNEFVNQLIVKVMPTRTPQGLTVGLFSCQNSHHPCLVGSFSVDTGTSANALREYQRHQAAAAPIKLANGVRGYLLHGPVRQPRSDFSSVMWEQDGMLYTITFLATERQNLLYMAYSMTAENPFTSLAQTQPEAPTTR